MPREHALRLRCLPLGLSLGADAKPLLTVAAAAGCPQENFRELRFIASAEIVVEPVPDDIIERAIAAAYGGQSDALLLRSGNANAEAGETDMSLTDDTLAIDALPIPMLLDAILSRAHCLAASDIHLEPGPLTSRLRFRVDGRLREDPAFSVKRVVAEQLVRRVKVLANLDTTCTFTPQEGAFTYKLSADTVRLRVSIIPQLGGEKLVVRVSPGESNARTAVGSDFSQLGLTAEQEAILRGHLASDRGAILLTGPTGSGKTTLLYAALESLNTEWRNIVTLEDPIERALPGINQTEAHRSEGNTFSGLLPAILRQDPDVIMVGEIRDASTAETALTAALTGHLVLSTVHAGDCFEAFNRLEQLRVDKRLMLSAIRLVVSQRLLPKNCLHCLRRFDPGAAFASLFRLERGVAVTQSQGCALCGGTGTEGRLGVFELLSISGDTARALESRLSDQPIESARRLRSAASAAGFVPLSIQIREALLAGVVGPANALRALGAPPELFGFPSR